MTEALALSSRDLREMDDFAVTVALRKACNLVGGQAAWASRHGVTRAYVNRVLSGDSPPGPAILDALNLRKVTMYLPTNGRAA